MTIGTQSLSRALKAAAFDRVVFYFANCRRNKLVTGGMKVQIDVRHIL
jgi:hypothetical protein